jgi:hypothetical protein
MALLIPSRVRNRSQEPEMKLYYCPGLAKVSAPCGSRSKTLFLTYNHILVSNLGRRGSHGDASLVISVLIYSTL